MGTQGGLGGLSARSWGLLPAVCVCVSVSLSELPFLALPLLCVSESVQRGHFFLILRGHHPGWRLPWRRSTGEGFFGLGGCNKLSSPAAELCPYPAHGHGDGAPTRRDQWQEMPSPAGAAPTQGVSGRLESPLGFWFSLLLGK